MKNNLKENKAVTLVALIITIVLMIIIASVTISAINNNNGEGLIDKTKQASNDYTIKQEKEIIQEAIITAQTIRDNNSFLTRISNSLQSEQGVKSVTVIMETNLKVTFDTGNIYNVDEDGNITAQND